jgi:hypothetical protein
MVQVFDDELSRVFFAERVIVVEGDSEVLAIKNTLHLLPEAIQKSIAARYQLMKARGKASIISLVKYLRELNIQPVAIHDGDFGVVGAERFNRPIAEAVGETGAPIVLDKCLEDMLGYTPPVTDKPFQAFAHTSEWRLPGDVPTRWRETIQSAFPDVLKSWPPE